MPISTTVNSFTKQDVDHAPASAGVYGLYANGATIYYGHSEVSIRTRLQRHQSGKEGPCTESAQGFNYELTSDAEEREEELLEEHKGLHDGELPKCNKVAS